MERPQQDPETMSPPLAMRGPDENPGDTDGIPEFRQDQ